MSYGNVIPIDAEVARQLERRQTRFRVLVGVLVAAWLAILVPAVLLTPLPPLGPFLVLAALVVIAEHRSMLFGDETGISAGMVVIVAAALIFAKASPIAGPLLIASLGGAYLPHLRAGELTKVAFNTSGMALAGSTSAIVTILSEPLRATNFGLVMGFGISIAAYWVANNCIVALHQGPIQGNAYVHTAVILVKSDTEILVWTMVGCVAATFAHTQWHLSVTLVALIVASHIALNSSYGIRLRRRSCADCRYDGLLLWLVLAGLLAANRPSEAVHPTVVAAFAVAMMLPMHRGHRYRVLGTGVPLLAVVSIGSLAALAICAPLVAFALCRRRSEAGTWWTTSVAMSTLLCIPLLAVLPAPTDWLSTSIRILAPYVLIGAGSACIFSLKLWRASPRLDARTALGVSLPTGGVMAACFVASAVGLAAMLRPHGLIAAASILVALRYAAIAIRPRNPAPFARRKQPNPLENLC